VTRRKTARKCGPKSARAFEAIRFRCDAIFPLPAAAWLFAVVHFLHEIGKLSDFLGHFIGDFLCVGGSFFRLRLDVRPFVRRGRNLRCDDFEILDFFCNLAQRLGFNEFSHHAIIENERQTSEHRTDGDAGAGISQ